MLRHFSVLIVIGITTTRAGPCDIYDDAFTPCVAAHSTVRALYDDYTGSLYQVERESDKKKINIRPKTRGGIANSATHDKFCKGTSCEISIIYDQSDNANHLTSEAAGAARAEADRLAITIGEYNDKAYGVWIKPGVGYRCDNTTGIPTGDQAETIYMVADSRHYNAECCFDYGNGAISGNSPGTMEAVYIGSNAHWTSGAGAGPWVMADLENGLYGCTGKYCPNIPTVDSKFLVAMLKGESGGTFTLKQGDARNGPLMTIYDGPRPDSYSIMNKEGGIVLGVGGSNNTAGSGSFYEGIIVRGVPPDDVDMQIQDEIMKALYGGRKK